MHSPSILHQQIESTYCGGRHPTAQMRAHQGCHDRQQRQYHQDHLWHRPAQPALPTVSATLMPPKNVSEI